LKTDDRGVQVCVVGAIAIIVVSIVGVYVYDLSEDETIVVTQNKDVKPQSEVAEKFEPQHPINDYRTVEQKVRDSANRSEGRDAYYDYAEDYGDSYDRSLDIIERAQYSCSKLLDLWETNWAWHTRNWIAELLVERCF